LTLQIVDAKKHPLKDEEAMMLAEIETHPKVQEYDTDIHTNKKSEMYRLFKKFLETLPSNKKQIFLVGKLNGKVIGFLGIYHKSKRMKHVGVVGITVHPDYWNRGFGTNLLEAGIEHARKEGLLRLEADTLAKNKAMLRIAEKVSFKLEGIRRIRIKIGKRYEDEALLGMILARERHATS
jgi:RimJ/RimL family protein N-acetyltransferase